MVRPLTATLFLKRAETAGNRSHLSEKSAESGFPARKAAPPMQSRLGCHANGGGQGILKKEHMLPF
jgi:hypothetical protein